MAGSALSPPCAPAYNAALDRPGGFRATRAHAIRYDSSLEELTPALLDRLGD